MTEEETPPDGVRPDPVKRRRGPIALIVAVLLVGAVTWFAISRLTGGGPDATLNGGAPSVSPIPPPEPRSTKPQGLERARELLGEPRSGEAWLSGIWFDLELIGGAFQKIANVLPFVHGVELARAALAGNAAEVWTHLPWVLGYGIVLTGMAILCFLRQMHVK